MTARRASTITEAEYKRMFKAARKAGLTPEVKPDGTIRFVESPSTTGPDSSNAAQAREVVM